MPRAISSRSMAGALQTTATAHATRNRVGLRFRRRPERRTALPKSAPRATSRYPWAVRPQRHHGWSPPRRSRGAHRVSISCANSSSTHDRANARADVPATAPPTCCVTSAARTYDQMRAGAYRLQQRLQRRSTMSERTSRRYGESVAATMHARGVNGPTGRVICAMAGQKRDRFTCIRVQPA